MNVSSTLTLRYTDIVSQGDGLGINGGVQKPDPMLRINMGGTFENVQVNIFEADLIVSRPNTVQLVNSPGRAVAIGGSSLTVSGVTVNNGSCNFLA
jgi:galacturan 1,4-alpha-galacturonidase